VKKKKRSSTKKKKEKGTRENGRGGTIATEGTGTAESRGKAALKIVREPRAYCSSGKRGRCGVGAKGLEGGVAEQRKIS